MWKNDCSVLRDDSAHHNWSRQLPDINQVEPYPFYEQATCFTLSRQTKIQAYLNTTCIWLLSFARALSGHGAQIWSFSVKQGINQKAACILTYSKWLLCGQSVSCISEAKYPNGPAFAWLKMATSNELCHQHQLQESTAANALFSNGLRGVYRFSLLWSNMW